MATPALVSSTRYRRLSFAAIDAAVSARLGPTRIKETHSRPVSTVKLRCILQNTLAAGVRRLLAGSITGVITQRYAAESNGSNRCVRVIRMWMCLSPN